MLDSVNFNSANFDSIDLGSIDSEESVPLLGNSDKPKTNLLSAIESVASAVKGIFSSMKNSLSKAFGSCAFGRLFKTNKEAAKLIAIDQADNILYSAQDYLTRVLQFTLGGIVLAFTIP